MISSVVSDDAAVADAVCNAVPTAAATASARVVRPLKRSRRDSLASEVMESISAFMLLDARLLPATRLLLDVRHGCDDDVIAPRLADHLNAERHAAFRFRRAGAHDACGPA